jgi:hypothetical protein
VLEGRGEDALALERRAVAHLSRDRRTEPGEEASARETLAHLELFHGSASAAEEQLVKAMDIRRRSGEAVDLAAVLAQAAEVALAGGALDAAQQLAERAKAEGGSRAAAKALADVAWMRVPRSNDDDLLMLVEVGKDTPELAAAAARLAELEAVQEAELPAGHPDLLVTLDRQVVVCALRGDAEGASAVQRTIVALGGGSGHEGGLEARKTLVDLLVAAGKPGEAASEQGALVKDMEGLHGKESPQIVPALERYYEVLMMAKEKREAKAVKKRLKSFGVKP